MTAIAFERVPAQWGRVLALTLAGVFLLAAAFELYVGFTVHNWGAPYDYWNLMDATHRWMSGGSLYYDWQLHGPYLHRDQDMLYPPTIVWLLVPMSFLPLAAWYLIPAGIIAAALWRLRPAPWALAVMAGLFAFGSVALMEAVSGEAITWVVAALFAAAAWHSPASLILVKPSLLPFAFFRTNRRTWWLGVGLLVLLTLPVLPLVFDWLRVVFDLRGRAGILYSVDEFGWCLIPYVAWLGRQEKRTQSNTASIVIAA